MDITTEELRLFRDAYEIDLGESLTLDEARMMLGRLVFLYEQLAKEAPVALRKNVTPRAGESVHTSHEGA